MPRCVLYARVSADDRGNDDRNLHGQLAMCREYATAHGYSIAGELAEDDRGASGAAFELPQLNRIRALAEARAFDVLVVREIDRLSRSLAKQLFVEEELQRGGVRIEYVLGAYAPTAEGNLMKNIRASVAEYERLKISERMNRGRTLKVQAGSVLVYARPPFGYRVVAVDHLYRLEIVETEAAIVRQIFAWYTGPEPLSAWQITQRLQTLGIPSPADLRPSIVSVAKRFGWGAWNRGTVIRILANETYAGVWHWHKDAPAAEQIAVAVPALVDADTWAATVAKRQANRIEAIRNTRHSYMLRSRITCGLCGARLCGRTIISRYGAPWYYGCPHSDTTDVLRGRCLLAYFPGAKLEGQVWAWIEELLTDPAALAAGMAAVAAADAQPAPGIEARLAEIAAQLADIQRQLERLLRLYVRQGFDEALLDKERAALQAQAAALEAERATLRSQVNAARAWVAQATALTDQAAEIAAELADSRDDTEFRRRTIVRLDVRIVAQVRDGARWVAARCVLGGREWQL